MNRSAKARPGARQSANQRKVSPARRTAFDTLRRVEEDDAYASVLLATLDDELREEDRRLCYELVLGTIRWQGWLDKVIEHFAGRSAATIDPPVKRALRLGLYQLRFLERIPYSAAVNESVNLAYMAGVSSAASFVNAVLRRATREPEFDPTINIQDPIERAAIATSHPTWLVERWEKAFGMEEAIAFARSNNAAPPVSFRLASCKETSDDPITELIAAGVQIARSDVADGAWRVNGPFDKKLRRMADDGRIYLQDEASQLVVNVLGAQPRDRVLDVCAAPGSKTTNIVQRTAGLGLVVAGDLYSQRLMTVLKSNERTGCDPISTVAYDATQPLPFRDQWFDRVLVDSPCTGTGTLRRNPEIRWRISPSDIDRLASIQSLILSNAARMVKVGGRLVYSTCSVEAEENESVVAGFVREHIESFTMLRADAPASLLQPDGTIRTWPQMHGTDGFFIAAFERKA